MTLLGLILAAAIAPDVEVQGGAGCVDASALQRAIDDHAPPPVSRARLELIVEHDRSGVRASIRILSPRGNDERSFSLGPDDCPLLPALVARIYRRYAESLPQLKPLEALPPNRLRPRGFSRQRVFLSVAAASDGSSSPRLGIQAGLARGRLGGPQWVLQAAYDVLMDRAAGDGRLTLHRLWAGAGVGLEHEAEPWSMAGELLLGAGAALALARDFDQRFDPALPVVNARLQSRIRWPGGRGGIRPHVGFAAELALARIRLSAPGGGYEAPWARVELALGFGWGDVW